MYSVAVECAASDAESRSAELWDAGCCGIQEEELPGGRVLLRAFFHDKGRLPGEWRQEPDVDWEAAARAAWPAREIGRTLYLAPEWNTEPVPAGRKRVTIYPGLAAGTGDHPATELCLLAMERYLQSSDVVLDLGCGSGILGAAALALGAPRVTGCDIDLPSVLYARQYVSFPLFAGSLRSVASRSADVIVANLNLETLLTLTQEIGRVARRAVIASGFRAAEAGSLLIPGFRTADTLSLDQWACLVFFRDAPF